jgi:hypothetical protein
VAIAITLLLFPSFYGRADDKEQAVEKELAGRSFHSYTTGFRVCLPAARTP